LNEFYKDDIFNATQGDAAGGPDVTCHDHKEGDFGMFCPKDHAFMKDVWDTAVDIFCDQYKWKFIMPTGQWYRTKLVGFPCGSVEADNKGKHCDFAGVIRMDRDTNRATRPRVSTSWTMDAATSTRHIYGTSVAARAVAPIHPGARCSCIARRSSRCLPETELREAIIAWEVQVDSRTVFQVNMDGAFRQGLSGVSGNHLIGMK
jgi:hypothetical protein